MYEEYYGFSERPFQLTPDPAFYYESVTHKKALSYLGYGLNQGEGFVVITGEVGAGKSTLVAHLKQKLDDDRMTVGEVVTSALDGEEMIHVAARSFGLDVTGGDKAADLAAIELFLHEEARNGRRTLLIVDEAQNLSIGALEELRMLSNYQKNGKPLLQSFLLGQEELQPILRAPNMEQFRQRIVASCHLSPLTEDECQAYIEYRMQHAGYEGNTLFSSDAYDKIFVFTRGVPRKINTLMDRILLYGFLEELESFDETAVEAVVKEVADEMFLPDNKVAEDGPRDRG